MEKSLGTSFLSQVVLISSIKPTLSSYSNSLNMGSAVYWREDSSFQEISQIVSGLELINDAAELSVQFDNNYNEILTTNESLITTTKHTSDCITNTQDFH